MMSRNWLLAALAGAALAGWLPNAGAQQKYVVLDNVPAAGVPGAQQVGGDVAIPLSGNASVSSDGNIVVNCQIPGSNCPGIGSGGGSTTITNFPAVTFTFTGSPDPVTAAGATLSWSATNAHACYGFDVVRTSSTGPAAPTATWKITHPQSGTYSLNTLYNAVGAGNTATYKFTLRCFSSQYVAIGADFGVGAREGEVTVTLSPPQGSTPGNDACTTYYPTGHAARSEAGFQTSLVNNSLPFTTFATFCPGCTGTPVTFANLISQGTSGIATLPGPDGASGHYLSIPVDVPANAPDGVGFELTWVSPNDGGATQMPGSMEISISPCAGDFRVRPANNTSSDYWARRSCRITATGMGGPLVATTGTGGAAPANTCFIPKGQRLYINMSMHNMNALRSNPSSTPVSTCSFSNCGYKFTASRYYGN